MRITSTRTMPAPLDGFRTPVAPSLQIIRKWAKIQELVSYAKRAYRCAVLLVTASALSACSSFLTTPDSAEKHGYSWSYEPTREPPVIFLARDFHDILVSISCGESGDKILFTAWSPGSLTTVTGSNRFISTAFNIRLPATGEYFIDTDESFYTSTLNRDQVRQIFAGKKGLLLKTPVWSAYLPGNDGSIVEAFMRDCEVVQKAKASP